MTREANSVLDLQVRLKIFGFRDETGLRNADILKRQLSPLVCQTIGNSGPQKVGIS